MQIRLHYVQEHSTGAEVVSSCWQAIFVKGSGPSSAMVSQNAAHIAQVYKVMSDLPLVGGFF